MKYVDMSREQLLEQQEALKAEYAAFAAKGHKLDMSRGKPSPEQLELSAGLLDAVDSSTDFAAAAEVDVRNYGGLEGIEGARRILGHMMGIPASNVIALNNSSLKIMYDLVAHAMTHGIMGSIPWAKLDSVKFLCPSPGYDRHFSVCEHFGIEMVVVPMGEDGPDMDMVEELVSSDESVKGIWCVPQYSNPQGYVYSDETVARFAALKPAASDFRIFWDNAYVLHHLYEDHPTVANIKDACDAAGNPDIYYEFASTSKISFAGAGISGVGASDANIADIKKFIFFSMICPDKINQLRHAIFFAEEGSLEAHMRKHAELIRPKFEMVESILSEQIGELGIGAWTSPRGGYFICFDGLPGTAKRIVELAAEAGVKMTGAGAMYPYKRDPEDKTIRIAPTYPSVEDLRAAAELFSVCVKLASIEKLLEA